VERNRLVRTDNHVKLRLLIALCLVTGCMRRSAVWLVPHSTAEHLRFGYGATRGSSEPLADLQWMRVSACGVGPGEHTVGERVLWLASGSAVDPAALAGTVLYGEPPRGLVTRRGPKPLVPGCYVFSISGNGISASVCFEVPVQGEVYKSPATDCELRARAS
jgi:hypothetical protein